MYNNKENISTEFNSNLIRLISFNKLLDDCNEFFRLCSFKGNNVNYLQMLKDTIITIYAEVSPKLTKEEKEEIRDLFKKSKTIGRVIITKKTENGTIKLIDGKNFSKHKYLLHNVVERLRELSDDKGMLITNKKTYDNIIGEDD